MFQVDNSGKGNCMYYAYSISLMYYLRAKNVPDITENIFTKLKLKEDDKVQLRTLLSKKENQEFTSNETKMIIEPILGRATRDLAAEYTKYQFKSSPQDTPLFAAAKYGLEFYFKKQLVNDSELVKLIDHEFTNPNFTDAEIYKMASTDLAMTEYTNRRMPHVVDKFHRLWAIKEKEFKKDKKQLTKDEIKVHQEKLLDNILKDETVNFFLAENEKYLNQYKEHLQKESVWGTEETLLLLHRAIQGERMIRNEKRTIDTFYDTEIVLHLYRNGRSPFTQFGSPVMILNNQSNVHWTSIIPDSIFSLKKSSEITQKDYPEEIALFVKERKQTGPRVARALKQMYRKGLEGNEEYSSERCMEIAQHYLNYVKHKNRHFQLSYVQQFIEEMGEIIKNTTDTNKSHTVGSNPTLVIEQVNSQSDPITTAKLTEETLPTVSLGTQDGTLNRPPKDGLTPYILQEYPQPTIYLENKNKSFKKDKQFTHPYGDEDITLFYKTIYDWVDTLTDKSFKSLINSTLTKYEAKIWGSMWGASRRAEVDGYLKGNCNAKALAMIFMNGEEASTLNECLFVKIVETIKKEINKYPVLLQEQKYQLISQLNLEEHKVFYLANLKSHHETISASQRQLQCTSSLTC